MQDLRLRGSVGSGRAGLPAVFPRWPGGRVVAGCKTCPEFLSVREQQTTRQRSVEMRALFAMPILDTRKLTVSYMSAEASDVKELNQGQPRRYTVTHNDLTAQLHLSIGEDFNQQQISGWYSKLVRDEVVAEWSFAGGPALHLHCHVSGAVFWLASAQARNTIFAREMPLVLDSIAFAERALFKCATLQNAAVFVHFEAREAHLARVEYWGTLGEWICRDQSSSVRKHLDRVSHTVLGARPAIPRAARLEGSLSSLLDTLAAFRISGPLTSSVNSTGEAAPSTPLDASAPVATAAQQTPLELASTQSATRQGTASRRSTEAKQSRDQDQDQTRLESQQARSQAALPEQRRRRSTALQGSQAAQSSKAFAAAVADRQSRIVQPSRRRTRNVEHTATTEPAVARDGGSRWPQGPPSSGDSPRRSPAQQPRETSGRQLRRPLAQPVAAAAAGSIHRNAQGSWRALYSPHRCLLCGGALPQQSSITQSSGPRETVVGAPASTGSSADSTEACTCVHYHWSPAAEGITKLDMQPNCDSSRVPLNDRASQDSRTTTKTRCTTRPSEPTLVGCAMPRTTTELPAEHQPSLVACSAQASPSPRSCNSSSSSTQHSPGRNSVGPWLQGP